jgi:putative flippase GtrA
MVLMSNLFFQLCRFGLVGIVAALMHFSIVVTLVQTWHMHPLVANIVGFLFSFQLSFWGHRLWTFSDSEAPHRVAYPKLLTVQLINLAANETLFYILLSLQLPYTLALAVVLTVLPVFTFVSSKFWVFKS